MRTPRLIRCNKDIIDGRLLGEHGHLTLDQGGTAIGAARPAGILEYSLLDNLRAKAHSRPSQRFGIKLVFFM
jgi:hypothetical protein